MSRFKVVVPAAAFEDGSEAVFRDLCSIEGRQTSFVAWLQSSVGDRGWAPRKVAEELLTDAPEGAVIGVPPALFERLVFSATGRKPEPWQVVDGSDDLLNEVDDGVSARLLAVAARLAGLVESWDAQPLGIWAYDRLVCGGAVVLRATPVAESSPRVVWVKRGGRWVPHPDVRWPGRVPALVEAGPVEVLGVILGVLRAHGPRSEVQLAVLLLELVAPLVVPTRVVRDVVELRRLAVPPFVLHAGVQLLPWPAQVCLVVAWRIAQWVDEAWVDHTMPGWDTRPPSWNADTEGAQNLVGLCELLGLPVPGDGGPPVAAICRLLHVLLTERVAAVDGFGVSSLRGTLRNSAAIGRLTEPGEDRLLGACAWFMEHFLECHRPEGKGGRYSDIVGRLGDRIKNARSAARLPLIMEAIFEELLRRFGGV